MPPYTVEPADNGARRQWFVAAGFAVLALVVYLVPPGQQQRIAGVLRATVLQPFVLTQEAMAGARFRAVENERLRARLDSVVAVLGQATPLAAENRRLRELLELSERVGASFRPAGLLRFGTAGSQSVFLIDRGEEDGVRESSTVVTREGLVGVVRETRGGTSLGMDWSHPDFRASAMDVEAGVFGIVEPVRGTFREDDRLLLNGTPYFTDLAPGTLIVTSGRGGIYPRGIPIGTVEGLAEEEAGWRRSWWVRPAVPLSAVTHVLVSVQADAVEDDLSGAWPTAETLRSLGVDPAVIEEPPPAREAPDTAVGSGGVL